VAQTIRLAAVPLAVLGLSATAPSSGAAPASPAAPSASTAPATPARGRVARDALGVSAHTPFRFGHRPAALAGGSFTVAGRAGRPAHGRRVIVRLLRGDRVVAARRVRIDSRGRFTTVFRPRRSGAFTVRAVLPAAPGRLERRGRTRVGVYEPALHAGIRGPLVRWVQAQLHDLGYLDHRATGRWDLATGVAVLAYRSANGIGGLDERTHTNLRVIGALRDGRRGFRARYGGHGHHVEADLSKQIVVLLDGRRVDRILHMSSGKRSTPTILGSFRFYSKDPGFNSSGMYNANYFVGGYAVHGYKFVPEYPDSHGCLRIPMSEADFVFSWIRNGDRIDIYP